MVVNIILQNEGLELRCRVLPGAVGNENVGPGYLDRNQKCGPTQSMVGDV